MTRAICTRLTAATLAALLTGAAASAAPVAPFSGFAPDQGFAASSNFMRGYGFDVVDPISVSALAVFDAGADGWSGNPSVFVGLWSVADPGTALATAEVAPGSPLAGTIFDTGNVSGQFRYVPLGTPLVLEPGSYRVAAETDDIFDTEDVAFNVRLTGLSSSIANIVAVSTFAEDSYPSVTGAAGYAQLGGTILTGNMETTNGAAAIPLPASFTMLLGGFGIGVWVTRRRWG